MLFLQIMKIASLGVILKAKDTIKRSEGNVKWNQMFSSRMKTAKGWLMSTIREDPRRLQATF